MADVRKNLMLPRSRKSVWDEPGILEYLTSLDRQRWITAAAGAALGLLGLRRRGIAGGLIATAGASLAVRALSGRHDLDAGRDLVDRCLKDWGWRRSDVVDDASQASFPASDSPAWSTANAQ